MDTLDNSAFDKSGQITDSAMETIRSTIPWMKFISITGFILLAFMVVSVLYQMFNTFGFLRYTGLLYIGYFIVGSALFILNLFLFQYANNLSHYIRSKQSFDLEVAFQKQKTFYMVAGILLAMYLIFLMLLVIWSMSSSNGF